jgi:hypothetical protein
MARCPNGHENPDGQRFCGECGAAISRVEPTGPPPEGEPTERAAFQRRAPGQAAGPPPGPVPGPIGTTRRQRRQARRPWYRKTWALVMAVVLAVLLIGGTAVGIAIALGGGGGGHTIRGDYQINNGASDVSDGDQVVIKGADDKTAGTGVLHRTKDQTQCKGPGTLTDCFTFTVNGVKDSDSYTVHVRNHGSPTFQRDRLAKNDWRVSLTLTVRPTTTTTTPTTAPPTTGRGQR